MSEQKKKKSWMDRYRDTPELARELGESIRMMDAKHAWTYARAARRLAVSTLRRIAALPLSHDQAKRSANQVAKLREELMEVEATFRKAAEETEHQ